MKTAYLDIFAGISGDMTLGALLDLGLDMNVLEAGLARLGLHGYELKKEPVSVSGIAATRLKVEIEHHHHEHHHRRLGDILALIDGSGLNDKVRSMSRAVFQKLAEAEGRVHGTGPEEVHFHEVGAVDSIVDIVGSCIGFDALGLEKIVASPLPLGRGLVECAHGVMPLPAPATVELLTGLPTLDFPEEGETVTPTGAAIVAALCSSVGPMPALRSEAVGYGAGTARRRIPNLLRIVVGREIDMAEAMETVVIEATVDDMNPEICQYLSEKLFEAGALDVTLTPCVGKNGRPAVTLSVVADPSGEEGLTDMLLTESTSLGARKTRARRVCLERERVQVEVAGHSIAVKLGLRNGRLVNVAPEYRDCRAAAEASGLPLKEIYRLAVCEFEKEATRH